MIDSIAIIYTILYVLLISFVLYINYYKKNSIPELFKVAETNSKFLPTVYEIYDKSNETTCDRFIIVQPFQWFVWAIKGELYVLCPEKGNECGLNSISAIRFTKNNFQKICLHLNFTNLYEGYKRETKKIIPYEITSERFTVITAINDLLTKFITFEDDSNIDTGQSRGFSYTFNNSTLTFDQVSQIGFTNKTSHNELIKSYIKHVHK